jgi:hypothetical protein
MASHQIAPAAHRGISHHVRSSSGGGDVTMSVTSDERFGATLEKLTTSSIKNHYNVYQRFKWPDSLPADTLWMSPELLSVYGTPVMEQLDEPTLKRLTKWESINFYSLNVHGIRELIIEVTRRIHAAGYEVPSEFFHRFIGEENDHMWFFAQFCLRYGPRSIRTDRSGSQEPPIRSPKISLFLRE